MVNTLEFPDLTGISPVAVASFGVTRYSKSMKTTAGNRGRPRKDNALTAAERMRAYRKRKRDAGLKNVRRWEPAEGVRQYWIIVFWMPAVWRCTVKLHRRSCVIPICSTRQEKTSSVGVRSQQTLYRNISTNGRKYSSVPGRK